MNACSIIQLSYKCKADKNNLISEITRMMMTNPPKKWSISILFILQDMVWMVERVFYHPVY
jgi:hypothetical protein